MLHLPIAEFFLALAMLAGLVMYATYDGCDPLTLGLVDKPDQVRDGHGVLGLGGGAFGHSMDTCAGLGSLWTAFLNMDTCAGLGGSLWTQHGHVCWAGGEPLDTAFLNMDTCSGLGSLWTQHF